ncbi:MAG TPA: LysM domain-containing protein [Pyrinomonadaceae bacterium]|jgi:LysM repeat protein
MPQIADTHEVRPGETLSKIANKFHITLQELLAVNPQIANPNLIMIGDVINIPSDEPEPVSDDDDQTGAFDGIHPAQSTVSINRADLILPPLTNDPGKRQRNIYDQVLNQFAVGHNPRYIRTGQATFCNIFTWDVTRAMGAQIPHWINSASQIMEPFTSGASEVNANGTQRWLENFGSAHGWNQTDEQGAQAAANQGKPAVAVRRNPIAGRHGHIVMVRPGSINSRGPATAQAGSSNFNMGHLRDGFADLPNIKFFKHE